MKKFILSIWHEKSIISKMNVVFSLYFLWTHPIQYFFKLFFPLALLKYLFYQVNYFDQGTSWNWPVNWKKTKKKNEFHGLQQTNHLKNESNPHLFCRNDSIIFEFVPLIFWNSNAYYLKTTKHNKFAQFKYFIYLFK